MKTQIQYQKKIKSFKPVSDHGCWYYFDPVSGLMRTGWQNINEKDYYLNPGVIAAGSFSVPVGALFTDTTTPDGFRVDANGARV